MNRKQNLPAWTKKPKPKLLGFEITPLIIIAAVLAVILTIYIAYRTSMNHRKLFPISLLALLGGLLFESLRISDSWKRVVSIFAVAYFLSFISLLPGKSERQYDLETHIYNWPYFLLFIYAAGFTIFHIDRVTARLTEGITLLLSLSFIYWMIDYGFTKSTNWFAVSLLLILCLLAAFSIVNALTNIPLSKKARLVLSIWSTLILFVFAVDNIFHVFHNPAIESAYMADALYIFLQFFLVGVSAVYSMQNFLFLATFLPSKDGNYKEDFETSKIVHIERYSDQQVSISQSLFCIAYAGVVYSLNYRYQFLPRHTMIWLVILTFPMILFFANKVKGLKT